MRSLFRARLILFTVPVFLVSTPRLAANDRLEDYLLMRCLIGEGRLHEAIDRCQELIDRYPDYLALYEALPEISLYARELDNAQQYFLKRIEYGKELALCYFGLGEVYYYKEEFEYAYQACERATELGLSQPECVRQLEYALSDWVGNQESIRYFTALCHRYPANAGYWYATALGLFAKGQWSKAKYYIDEAVRIDPFQPEFAELQTSIALKVMNSDSLLTRCQRLADLALDRGDLASYFFLEASRAYDIADDIGESFNTSGIYELLSKARLYGFRRWYSWALIKIGDHLAYESRYDSALTHYVLAERTASESRYHEGVGLALTAQIDILIDRARYMPAIEASLRLLRIAQESPSADQWMASLIKIGRSLHEMGLDELAVVYVAEALDSLEISGSETNTAILVYDQLGQIYLGLGNPDLSIKYFRLALSTARKFGQWVEAVVNGNLAIALARTGKIAEARASLEAQLRGTITSGYRRETCYAFAYLADFYQLRSDRQRARAMYDSADAIAGRLALWPVRLLCDRGRAALARTAGDEAEALVWAERAFNFVDSSEEVDAACGIGLIEGTSFRTDCETVVSILVSEGKIKEAFGYLDRFNMHRINTGLRSDVLSPLRASRNVRRWATRKGIAGFTGSLFRRPGFDFEPNQSPGGRTAGWSIEKKHPLALRDILSTVAGPGDALLSYLVTEDNTIGFFLNSDSLSCAVIPVGRAGLEEMLCRLSPAIGCRSESVPVVNAELANFSPEASALLYNLLLGPFENLFARVSNLILVLDDALRSLPFEVLADSGHQPLVVRFPISYALSPSLVRAPRQRGLPSGALLGLGTHGGRPSHSGGELSPDEQDPGRLGSSVGVEIPGAADEVKRIADIVGSNSVILTGADATRAALLEQASQFRIVHIAAHATIDRRVPWLSAIHCAAGWSSEDETDLTVIDILNLQFDGDMVVLSGCNTARTAGGKNPVGLSESFLKAGARSVVASLWYVDDFTTASFMESFYRYLMEGKTKAEALRLAKLSLIKAGKSDPFYWAPFILEGDPGPVELSRSTGISLSLGIACASVCMIVMGTLALRLKKRHAEGTEVG